MKNETKHLSVTEYFEVLKKEYIIAEFRRSIYHPLNDKRYYKELIGRKMGRILEVAKRIYNPVGSGIVDVEGIVCTTLCREREKFNAGWGCPIFEGLNKTDLEMYFLPGQRVIFKYNEQENEEGSTFHLAQGTITEFNLDEYKVKVIYNDLRGEGLTIDLLCSRVKRIF